MSRTYIGGIGSGISVSPNFTDMGGKSLPNDNVETDVQVKQQFSASFSKWIWHFSGTVTGSGVIFRKNATNGALTFPAATYSLGFQTDLTHTDNVANGDLTDLSITFSTAPVMHGWAAIYDTGGGQPVTYSQAIVAVTSSTGTVYFDLIGGGGPYTTEAPSQFKTRSAGSFSYMQVNVNAAIATTETGRFRKNTADGNQVVTLTANTTGIFVDTANTDSVASGDLVNISVTCTTAATFSYAPAVFFTATASSYDIGSDTTNARAASATATFYPVMGYQAAGSTTEANNVNDFAINPDVLSCSRARANATTNSYTASSTVVLRSGTSTFANLTQTFTVSSSTTGYFEDTTHTDDLTGLNSAAQGYGWSWSGGTSGNANLGFGLTINNNPPPPIPPCGTQLLYM